MSARYPFTGDKTLITHDGTVVWNEQVVVQPPSLDFSNVSDSTLTDSINDSYATVIEENETQYLSVLETSNDITLEDLHNLTLGNAKMETQETLEFTNEESLENLDINTVDVGGQQVVVFSLDGSDDLYGIQFMQDEEGNMQKYQFKFRTTDDGQLEAIPESIQLLSNDEEDDQNIGEDQILMQEIETEEEEVQETAVYLQEEPEVQETQVYLEEQLVEEQGDNLRVYVKGEDTSSDTIEGHTDDDQEFVESQEELEGNIEDHEGLTYADTETEVPHEVNYEEDPIDVKAGILEETLTVHNSTVNDADSNIKQEFLQEETNESAFGRPESLEYNTYNHHEEIIHPQYETKEVSEAPIEGIRVEHHIEGHVDNGYDSVEGDENNEKVLEYEPYMTEHIQQVYEGSDTTDDQNLHHEHYEQLFIEENHITGDDEKPVAISLRKDEQFIAEAGPEIDSDNDDYQIVEGLHITAEGEDVSASSFQEPETILQEVVKKPAVAERAKILRQTSLKNVKDMKAKNNKTVLYYVVPHVEKENVNSLSVNNTTAFRSARSNPRSILKSSFPDAEDLEVKSLADERLHKRFARSKEATRARLFNNFISKTTIPHAPVRQTRLPRKQQIKPVDTRRNEEIIVQEVMVSSNGFIENIEEKLKNKDKLEVTGYVVVTDSDEDYDPKQGIRKKKKHKKHRKMEGSESDDSDVSVIEIPSDEEEDKVSNENDSPKRGRGRPRKSIDTPEKTDVMKRRRGRPPKLGADLEESPQKRSRTESDEFESDSPKKEIKCPHCTKTFPSQNSLSTHIQHHNLENCLRKAGASRMSTVIEYKHKCDACEKTFKNSVLLSRHVCENQPQMVKNRLKCSLCKRTFPDTYMLNVHKRAHVKENLMNSTSVVKVSPKKFSKGTSSSKATSPKGATGAKARLTCKKCPRVCYSLESLALHEKTHTKFTCKACSASFPSRLLLDTHVRVNCVKPSSPANRRLSYKVSKTFVQLPKRKSGSFASKAAATKRNSTDSPAKSIWGFKLDCELCDKKFLTFKGLFKHQVKVHGLETPDENVLAEQKKRLHTPRNTHGGIPLREDIRKVFTDLKLKVALFTPVKGAK